MWAPRRGKRESRRHIDAAGPGIPHLRHGSGEERPGVTWHGGALDEVAGDAAVLVDPHDSEAIGDGIESPLHVTPLRATLAQKGLARAARFTWERTARETLRVYERAIASR